ncbi:AtpZ/AtpI family protein [Patescibacteria group bacterium]|nr:AtpZ/AtpI family protein [Patescibacteria group bacterium]MBU0963914.1 AtpZ/AtpI family protein [Patescibacteria group bacterium]
MENEPQKPWWQPGLVVFAEITGWIAVPILIALFLGKYLDEKYGTDPWYYLGLTAAAFIISSIGIGIIAAKYIKQIEKESKKNKDNKNLNERGSNTRGNNGQ